MSWIVRAREEFADFARDLTEAVDRLGQPHPDCPDLEPHPLHVGVRYRDDGQGLREMERVTCPGRP